MYRDMGLPSTARTQPSGSQRRDDRSRGQALVEFALVAPVLFLIIAGTIQFGLIFWSQNTLTQIARDTGRWAATQSDCADIQGVAATANAIADSSALFGYGSAWAGSGSDTSATNEVVVSWDTMSGLCPPENNQQVSFVTIRIDHQVPIFFPFVPGDGKLSTSAEFRMEPEPQ
jgi:Flp pilus assembly protein TadG